MERDQFGDISFPISIFMTRNEFYSKLTPGTLVYILDRNKCGEELWLITEVGEAKMGECTDSFDHTFIKVKALSDTRQGFEKATGCSNLLLWEIYNNKHNRFYFA